MSNHAIAPTFLNRCVPGLFQGLRPRSAYDSSQCRSDGGGVRGRAEPHRHGLDIAGRHRLALLNHIFSSCCDPLALLECTCALACPAFSAPSEASRGGLVAQDAECLAFPVDASGTALNYKIIVRDATVIAVLYKEGEQIRQSPFVEHRLPSPGAYVALSDGGLGVLQSLPRGLVVARTPRDLPAHEPQYAPRAGLRPKGKHPAELPGMADVKLLQEHGGVVWPHAMCSVPVCALQLADSARLQMWHMQWDEWVEGRAQGVRSLVETIEARLSDASTGGTAKVSELSSLYATLEEQNRELGEINVEAVGAERLAALQKGIQRFAALARYG
eukprot:5520388-Pleurochrysis_carterae.AAC.2